MKYLTPICILVLALGIAIGLIIRTKTPKSHSASSIITDDEQQATDRPFTFDDLLDAIEWAESEGDPNALGDNGNAIGAYQIHEIYVREVNRILKNYGMAERYTYNDRWDRDKSRRMSLIHNEYWAKFAMLVTDLSFDETFVRSHKGAYGYRTESTKPYWAKVKARMESVK